MNEVTYAPFTKLDGTVGIAISTTADSKGCYIYRFSDKAAFSNACDLCYTLSKMENPSIEVGMIGRKHYVIVEDESDTADDEEYAKTFRFDSEDDLYTAELMARKYFELAEDADCRKHETDSDE